MKKENMFKCKYRKQCELYDEDSCTCNSLWADRNYCEKYREFENKKRNDKIIKKLNKK